MCLAYHSGQRVLLGNEFFEFEPASAIIYDAYTSTIKINKTKNIESIEDNSRAYMSHIIVVHKPKFTGVYIPVHKVRQTKCLATIALKGAQLFVLIALTNGRITGDKVID